MKHRPAPSFLLKPLLTLGLLLCALITALPAASQPDQPILTPTAPSALGAPAAVTPQPASISDAYGWSCDDFPCEDDAEAWLRRIQVPPGFSLSLYGQFPGQPMQMTFGPDGRLYATVLENGTRQGAVYALESGGTVERITQTLESPVGLAFAPGTETLYISSRVTAESGGALWRVVDGSATLLIDDLPCCYSAVSNQPQGVTFGPDGYLYLGVSSLTDHAEPSNPQFERYATPQPYEGSILRIQPQNGAADVYAEGLRDPYDLAFAPDGRLYATDGGMLNGIGDRILSIERGAHYGFPFWRNRGCEDCPPTDYSLTIPADLLPLPPYTLPRGLTVYSGAQFPANYFGSVFVTLWNGTPTAQRVIRLDPDQLPADPEQLAVFTPEPFVTGLIRPVDVTVAPDGTLLVADFIYGFVWRVTWTGVITPPATLTSAPFIFATNTPQP
ncbi:MAG: PQQ-dependent sugar dehydrogenase [Chloroflexi bacterium]|nr:PQQ-dependent sugar dehydrogenase [Chloroflexota bacterium]